MEQLSDSDTQAQDFEPVPEPFPTFRASADLNFWASDSDSDFDFDSDPHANFFVTDLFAPSRRSNNTLEPRIDLGFWDFEGEAEDGSYEVPEFGAGAGVGGFSVSLSEGLRVTGLDSDSDYEEGVPGFGVMNLVDSSSEDGDGMGPVDGSDLRDGFGSEDLRAYNGDEWEEVEERVDAEGEGLRALDVIEELSEISAEEEEDDDPTFEEIRNLEWDILFAVYTLERDSILVPDPDFDSYLVHLDDDHGDVYATNQETLFGQFEEMESALKGSPPAAKTVVENLPLVELRKEDLGDSNVVCAVCKDDILPYDKVRKLPCCHYYHPDCILPWLSIRNTCPICRYELATDDAEYERRKAQRGWSWPRHGGTGQIQL